MLDFETFDCPHCWQENEWQTDCTQWDDLINGSTTGTQACTFCGREIKLELSLNATVQIKAKEG